MSAHPVRTALGAASIAGVALWFSRGALDVIGSVEAGSRVAMLPSWPELAGLVVLLLLVCAAGALRLSDTRFVSPGERTLAWDPARADALRPLCSLAVLLVPYLPWLPDRVPAVRILAGPGRWLLWAVVMGQVIWLFASRTSWKFPLNRLTGFDRRLTSIAIFGVSLAAYAATWSHVSQTGFFPGGDEPHYLVMTQSLLRDRDLKIENNHERGDYAEYYPSRLSPDYRARGSNGEIYSIHPVGLPILLAPAYAVGGYRAVVWFLMSVAAMTAAWLWLWTLTLTGSPGAATFAWAAVALSGPYVFNTFTVYPEIPAGLCVMIAASSALCHRALGNESSFRAPLHVWGAALAVAALPWLSTKYAAMAIVLAAILAWNQRRSVGAAVVLGTMVTSLAAWFGFFYFIWGVPLPSAPYGSNTQISLWTFFSGFPGVFFDQEYGVVTYAPVLGLGLVGLAGMWRDPRTRQLAVGLTGIAMALLVLVCSFALWWGGSAMPGRPIISILGLLGAPIAWFYKNNVDNASRRAVIQFLLLISLAVMLTMTWSVGGLLLAQGRDGSSSLLEWLSPTWHLWTSAPSYIMSSPPVAYVKTLLWIGAVMLVAWLCQRSSTTPGRAALRVTLAAVCVSTIVASVAASMPAASRQRRFDPEARLSFPLLDTFDAIARPLAIRYQPLSLVSPSVIPSLFLAKAVSGQRLAPQPLPVMLNARFRLPAGDYEVEIEGSDVAGQPMSGTVGLQVGREGNPLRTWALQLSPHETWRQRFSLPIDAEFVGFRAAPELERAIAALRLRPLSIVDGSLRLKTASVIATASFGSLTVFFHDAVAYSEPDGFWVRGRARLRTTIAEGDDSAESLAVQLHSGARSNRVTLSTPRWSERLELVPGVTRDVRVPSVPHARLVELTISTSNGFVPAEVQPGNRDRRLLGCWVAFAHSPTARE